MKQLLQAGFLLLFLSTTVFSQDGLAGKLAAFQKENGEKYIRPFAESFGGTLNTGLFSSAKVEEGFNLDLRLNVMGNMVSDEQKTFIATYEHLTEGEKSVETATIFGKDGATIDMGLGEFQLPDGLNLKFMASAAPTLTLGSLYGTEVSVRYFKYSLDENIEQITLKGFGARHSIDQYFDALPIDLSVGFFSQSFKVDDILETKLVSLHAETGFSVLFLDVMAGIALESNVTDITYTDNNNNSIAFNFEEKNKARFFAGLGFDFWLFQLHANAHFGDQVVGSIGLSAGF